MDLIVDRIRQLPLGRGIYSQLATPGALCHPSYPIRRRLAAQIPPCFKMLTRSAIAAILAVAPGILAAPAPQVTEPASFGPDAQVSYEAQSTAGPDYPLAEELGDGYTSATYHGPYTGTPTTTGAVEGPTTLAASIAPLPLNPTATYYNTGGKPLNPFPAPYTPAGGLGTNGTLPRYMVNSDFDYESIALGLYQVRYSRAMCSRSPVDI